MRSLSIILSFTLALAAVSQQDRATGHGPAADREESDAVFMIVGDVSTVDFGGNTLTYLTLLAGVAKRGAPSADKDYEVRFYPDDEGGMVGQIGVRYPQGADPNEYLDAAQSRLQDVVSKVHEASTEPLRSRLEAAMERQVKAEAIVDHLTQQTESLRKRAGAADVYPAALDAQLGALKNDRLTLRAEIAGLEARREGIAAQIAERSDKLRAERHGQEVLKELEMVIALREKQLEQTVRLFKSSVASQSEVMNAEVQLSTAKADLAERRRQVALAANSKLLEGLNEQLVSAQIELGAATARLNVIERTLESLESDDVRQLVNDYQRANRRLNRAVAEEELASAELTKTRRAADAVQPPRVVVFRRSGPLLQTSAGDEE